MLKHVLGKMQFARKQMTNTLIMHDELVLLVLVIS